MKFVKIEWREKNPVYGITVESITNITVSINAEQKEKEKR